MFISTLPCTLIFGECSLVGDVREKDTLMQALRNREQDYPQVSLSLLSTRLMLAAIVLLAFALRIYGVRFALPFSEHPDEPNLLNFVVGALREGDPNPHVFRKPHLYFYVLLPILWVHYRLGLSSGLYTTFDQMAVSTHKFTTIPGFFVWGRTVTAVVGTLVVLLTYYLARRVW